MCVCAFINITEINKSETFTLNPKNYEKINQTLYFKRKKNHAFYWTTDFTIKVNHFQTKNLLCLADKEFRWVIDFIRLQVF